MVRIVLVLGLLSAHLERFSGLPYVKFVRGGDSLKKEGLVVEGYFSNDGVI